MTQEPGYYRHPTLHGDHVVFVSEDDLWSVQTSGGIPRRLTTGLGASQNPSFSPDGKWIAFSGREEGTLEVYIIHAGGSHPKRLTHMGEDCVVAGWTPDGRVVFTCDAGDPFHTPGFYAVSLEGGLPEKLPLGPGTFVSYGPSLNEVVIQRHGLRFAYWKRYKGGTKGEVWVKNQNPFKKIVDLDGNVARPLWVNNRIYYASDVDGIGNLYSCDLEGGDVQQHTHHDEFYVRFQSTDGTNIIYQAGADLWIYDPGVNTTEKVAITYSSPRTQWSRKFFEASKYMTSFDLHPKGHRLAVVTRGKPVTFGNWEGAVLQHGTLEGIRYRFALWTPCGEKVVLVRNINGKDQLCLSTVGSPGWEECLLSSFDFGRIQEIKCRGTAEAPKIILTNHRHELIFMDLETKDVKVIDQSKFGQIDGFDISPDGKWVAYSIYEKQDIARLKLCHLETFEVTPITDPVLKDIMPAFDLEGKYLFFISYRHFNPVPDQLHFEMSFPRGGRPYLILLQDNLISPFTPEPKPDEDKKEDEKPSSEETPETPKEPSFEIHLDGIQDRIIGFPVEAGAYTAIGSAKGGKVFWQVTPVALEMLDDDCMEEEDNEGATDIIEVYSFETLKLDLYEEDVSEFMISGCGRYLSYRSSNNLRVVKTAEKPDDSYDSSYKKRGWIDLRRIKLSLDPRKEWEQMFEEAWALQRDFFWREDMAKMDWDIIKKRYLPLVKRVGSRAEMSDLLWEMQGELGTSHAYEYGGDYRTQPPYRVGSLGADYAYDPDLQGYKITHIAKGDFWGERASSPLGRPGIGVEVGDTLLAVNGKGVNEHTPPGALLVNCGGTEVDLTFKSPTEPDPYHVTVKPLVSQRMARYRDWVNSRRALTHEVSGGKVGYIHIPDMGPWGFSEFHRGFLSEADREGLVVDVRFNGGGSVSWLLLEKLARRRLGYDQSRWMGLIPYPVNSPQGPMVALTNQYAGSDGDMFSHSFKLLNLGPLIGKRTWGGVIGIWPRHPLVDGTITTQPEFSFWFKEGGWQVENYGAVPDIEVDITPEEAVLGQDPQLLRAIEETLQLIEAQSPLDRLKPEGHP